MQHRAVASAACGVALLCSVSAITTASRAAEPPKVVIKHQNSSTALQNCTEALRASAGQLGRADLKIQVDTKDGEKPSGALFTIRLATEPRQRSAAMIFQVPFLFQNPAHFGVFLKSDLYRELMNADNADGEERWLSTAFGGSYNLFSRDHAMTERKHFYNRYVGGASHAAIYSKIGGAPALAIILPNWRRDIDEMAARQRMVEAVELPLIDALPFGVARVSDVVNLTFSLPLTVFFYLDAPAPLPAASIRRITRWAEEAAAACSAANFQAERDALGKLKEDGKTVVPVNRPDFIEVGWTYAMTEAYGGIYASYLEAGWTVEDLDAVVRMGGDPKPRRLPSALLASLKPDQKKMFRDKTKDAAANRVHRKQRAAATDAVDTAWADGLMDIVDTVRQIDPRTTKPNGALNTDRWITPDVAGIPESTVRFRLEDMDEYIAAKKLPDCDGGCHSLISTYGGAAITLWKMGDQVAARRVLDLLERTALHRKDLSALITILKVRISLKDEAAARKLSKAVAGLGVPDAAQVEHMIGLAAVQSSLGERESAERMLRQAAELASNKRSRADMIQVANAYAGRGDAVTAWDLFARAIETATSPREVDWAVTSFALRSDELDATVAQVRDRLAKIEVPPKAQPGRAAR